MKCVNGCLIPESELDDAIELPSGKLECKHCLDKLWRDPKQDGTHDMIGRPTKGQKGRKCFNPAFTRGAYDPR